MKHTKVHQGSEEETKLDGHHNIGVALLGVVDHEKRYGRDNGYWELVPPSDIKHVV